MALNSVQQGFPQISAPLTNSAGFIQQAWLQLLISLWTRTGAAIGNSVFSSGDLKETAVKGSQPGWLECDGAAYSRGGYQSLFSVIGITYGDGDGSTTFNVPDYRGRFKIGTDASFPLGTPGGSGTQALNTGNLASHTHVVDDPEHTHTFSGSPHNHTINDPQHNHTSVVASVTGITTGASPGLAVSGVTGNSSTGITINNTTATGTNSPSATGITIENTGSGTPFSIMPPYLPVTVLIKT